MVVDNLQCAGSHYAPRISNCFFPFPLEGQSPPAFLIVPCVSNSIQNEPCSDEITTGAIDRSHMADSV